jgi:hypothetical protein
MVTIYKIFYNLILFLLMAPYSFSQDAYAFNYDKVDNGQFISSDSKNSGSGWKVGFRVGYYTGFTLGNYKDPGISCNYNFSSGDISGYNSDISFTAPIGNSTELYFTAGYLNHKITSKQKLNELRAVRGEPALVTIQMEGTLNLKYESLCFEYLLKQRLFSKSFFFLLGGGAEYNLNNKIEISEDIIDQGFVFLNSNSQSDVLYSSNKAPGFNAVGISAKAGFGFEFIIKKKYSLMPQVVLSYPLRNITNTNTLKIVTININLQFLFIL